MKFERNRPPQPWKRSLLLACVLGGWGAGTKAQDPAASNEPPPFIAAPKPPPVAPVASRPAASAPPRGTQSRSNSKTIPPQPPPPQRSQSVRIAGNPGPPSTGNLGSPDNTNISRNNDILEISHSPNQTNPAVAINPQPSAVSSMEERLRRMEEAYQRLERRNQLSEQSTKQLRAQNEELLRKYEDLSRRVSDSAREGKRQATSSTRTASRRSTDPAGFAQPGRPSQPAQPTSAGRPVQPDATTPVGRPPAQPGVPTPASQPAQLAQQPNSPFISNSTTAGSIPSNPLPNALPDEPGQESVAPGNLEGRAMQQNNAEAGGVLVPLLPLEAGGAVGGDQGQGASPAAGVNSEGFSVVPERLQGEGSQGRIQRGAAPVGPPLPTPPASPPSATPPLPGSSARINRMDISGEGAQGTGGRTSPEQQPAIGARGTDRRELQGVEGADQKPVKHHANVEFAEGLEFTSADKEFKVQFHNLTQADFRGFPVRNQGFLQSQFLIPRERWYFTGDLTKHIGFYTMMDHGYEPVDFYDMFVSIRYDERIKFRIGRMKTPYLYEDFSISEGDLIAPERSIYAGNYDGNREIGAMFLGELFGERLSYAVGAFDGGRKSYEIAKSPKDLFGYFQMRPFLKSERFKPLQYFNLGGSFRSGYEDQAPYVDRFQTANELSSSGTASVSPTFLSLNQNVIDHGELHQWAADIAWFYKSFFLFAEYGGSRAGYSLVNATTTTPVNVSGYNVTASYFLTGERLTRRVNVVKPLNDFNFDFLKPGGKFQPGAVEVFGRYSTMSFSQNIFTAGFADPNLWSDRVGATDIGLNWYLNFYTRIYLDWQHAVFANPVIMGPGKFAASTDLIWLRFQVFF